MVLLDPRNRNSWRKLSEAGFSRWPLDRLPGERRGQTAGAVCAGLPSGRAPIQLASSGGVNSIWRGGITSKSLPRLR